MQDKIARSFESGVQWMIFGLFGLLVALIFTQVCLRYIFSTSFVWAEEGSRFLFIWLVFLGISLGIHRKSHIGVTLLVERLKFLRRPAEILRMLFIITFFAVLTVTSWTFLQAGFDTMSSVLNIRLGWVYCIIPLSSVISMIFAICQLYAMLTGQEAS